MDVVTDTLCDVGTSRKINTQGFTGYGPKTHQEFIKVSKKKTRGLHVFVKFLKLGNLEFNEMHDIERFL